MSEKYSIQPEDPSDYINQKLERDTATPEEMYQIQSKMLLADFETDNVEIDANGSYITESHYHDIGIEKISSSDIPEAHASNLGVFFEEKKAKGFDTISEFISDTTISRADERVVSLSDLVPSGWSVVIAPGIPDTTDDQNKVISVRSLSTPLGIVALYHEAAHAEIYESLDENEKKLHYQADLAAHNAVKRGATTYLAVSLKVERDAWALAIKRMKPLLGKTGEEGICTREELLDSIHRDSLASYGEKFAEKLHLDLNKD